MTDCPKYQNGDLVTEDFISRAISCFRNNERLDRATILSLVHAAQDVFTSQPSLLEINIEGKELFTVCGDVHGQLFELLEIFKLNGNPHENHIYLFNGDFVDRGPCSIEVAVILYAYKLRYPSKFFINRGNHETTHVHVGNEFKNECLRKYDQEVFDAFSNSFDFLPLAAVINQRYFVVHGGPSVDRNFTTDDIRALRRPCNEDSLLLQLLWNDPVMPEEKTKTSRGGGVLFDCSVVDTFLDKEGFSLIIRSHEFTPKMADGHKTDGKCLTVFSAANYQGGVNDGSYINITPTTCNILTFKSPDMYPQWYNPYEYL